MGGEVMKTPARERPTRYLVCEPLKGQYSGQVVAVFTEEGKAKKYAADYGFYVKRDTIGWEIGNIVFIPFCG